MSNLAVVDYGSGNLRSVTKALECTGVTVRVISDPSGLEDADGLVVPGVGSFGDCARHLQQTGLLEAIRAWVQEDRPYLGICLGYQILFEGSEEASSEAGLGVLPGRVRRFSFSNQKVPHMGWNTVQPVGESVLYRGMNSPLYFYFVHSFYPEPKDPSQVSGWCEYGVRFAASVSVGRVHGTQFHPEKSQGMGLALLRNFVSSLK